MTSLALTERNVRELQRDPMSVGIAIVLPVALLLVLQSFGGQDVEFLEATMLTPGIVLFAFVMLMFGAATGLARDRESALLDRLLTTPLRAWQFVVAYSVPSLVIGTVQAVVLYAIGVAVGLDAVGSWALVALVSGLMLVLYVALGMIAGAILSVTQVAGVYTVILLLTVFGGAWFDLDELGGPLATVGDALPFKPALDASRAVLADGAGFGDIASDLGVVTAYAVVAAASAVGVFARRMRA